MLLITCVVSVGSLCVSYLMARHSAERHRGVIFPDRRNGMVANGMCVSYPTVFKNF